MTSAAVVLVLVVATAVMAVVAVAVAGVRVSLSHACRHPRRPKPDSVTTSLLSAKTVKVTGKCNACNTVMQQPRSLAKLPEIIAAMKVPTQRQLNLTGDTSPPVKPTFWTDADEAEIDASREGQKHVH